MIRIDAKLQPCETALVVPARNRGSLGGVRRTSRDKTCELPFFRDNTRDNGDHHCDDNAEQPPVRILITSMYCHGANH